MKFKKNYHNHRDRRRSATPKDHKGKQFVSTKPKVMNCFECGDADHLVKDCPQKKNKNSSKWNKDRKKKAMVASWSDSDSSSESESEEEHANLCLMAGQDDHIEVTVRNIISSPSEVISDVLK